MRKVALPALSFIFFFYYPAGSLERSENVYSLLFSKSCPGDGPGQLTSPYGSKARFLPDDYKEGWSTLIIAKSGCVNFG